MRKVRKVISSVLLVAAATAGGAALGENYHEALTLSESTQTLNINKCAAALLKISSTQVANTVSCDQLGYYPSWSRSPASYTRQELTADITKHTEQSNNFGQKVDITIGLALGLIFSVGVIIGVDETIKLRTRESIEADLLQDEQQLRTQVEEIFDEPQFIFTDEVRSMQGKLPPPEVEHY